MAIGFSGIITPMSIVFTAIDGKMVNITNAHINFVPIKDVIKQLQAAQSAADTGTVTKLHRKLSDLANVSKAITKASKGRVEVRDGVVFFDDEAIHNAIADRILWGLREGFDMKPYLLFLENLMNNPSKRSVDELYGFIEKSSMGITDDGMIVAYKRVRGNYRDIHSGKFDNSIGAVLEMARNKVDDNSERTCSYGFHFCSFTYLRHFGSQGSGDRIMIVKVNPADVVSIPKDYNDAKARACKYEVIGEYEGDEKDDILSTRAVWAGNAEWAEELPKSWEVDVQDDDAEDEDDWDSSDWESSDYEEDYDDEDDEAPAPVYVSPLDDLSYRIACGNKITEALYHYRPNGDFVKVVLKVNNLSEVTIFDNSLLGEIDQIVGRSEGTTKNRMIIVP